MVLYATDGEGPLVLNDNAAELYGRFVGPGYDVLSKWVMYKWDVEEDPGYKAGDTLRVIVPVLRAHGVNNEIIRDFSRNTIKIVPKANETIKDITSQHIPFVMISTSYSLYVDALRGLFGLNPDDVCCTPLDMDRYPLSPNDAAYLRYCAREISMMQAPEWPEGAKSLDDFDETHAETASRLNDIFSEILGMSIGRAVSDVDPVGGPAKASAIKEFVRRESSSLSEAVYTGDSVTDLHAFEEVRNEGGLSVSFNGNKHAVDKADIAVVSETTLPSSAIAIAHKMGGKKIVMDMASNWSQALQEKCLGDYGVPSDLTERLYNSCDKNAPEVVLLNEHNRKPVAERSIDTRYNVRGVAGALI
jgi:energy-converting hydrogenase A subunit R